MFEAFLIVAVVLFILDAVASLVSQAFPGHGALLPAGLAFFAAAFLFGATPIG